MHIMVFRAGVLVHWCMLSAFALCLYITAMPLCPQEQHTTTRLQLTKRKWNLPNFNKVPRVCNVYSLPGAPSRNS